MSKALAPVNRLWDLVAHSKVTPLVLVAFAVVYVVLTVTSSWWYAPVAFVAAWHSGTAANTHWEDR